MQDQLRRTGADLEVSWDRTLWRSGPHWDVLQDETTRGESKSELPMFGDEFLA
jgi:hypothetical protein